MKIKLWLCLLFIPVWASAQFSIEYTGGYGVYNQMVSVRDLLHTELEKVQSELPGAAVVADFPNFLTHSFGLNYVYGKEEFGLVITRLSSGGKIAYSDYSGKYANKINLSGTRIGTRYRKALEEFTLLKKYKVIFFGELSPGVLVTSLSHKSSQEYPTHTVDEENAPDYSSTSFTLLPQVGFRTSMGRIGLHLTAGYDLCLGGKIDNGYKTKLSWSGIRAGIGVSYVFPPKKDKPKSED